ncbi:MAG TPA: ABC transporter permease [Bacillota bacterium]|jgi:simple sugar transport system permease protein|nr:ABC transporter permease [Fastidiosipila sp.]HPX93415.1 ABC transporter permease [Bacillota bacterium]HQB81187.1 ABC transporter permease [Bacillota bacterium]
MSNTKQTIQRIGWPRLIIGLFFVLLVIVSPVMGLKITDVFSDVLRRWSMFGILILAMVPGVQSGIGLNFGVSLGIVAGLIGSTTAIELSFRHGSPRPWTDLAFALLIAIPIATLLGFLYGLLLNRVKGSEMTVSTYVGFSVIALSNIVWLLLPFRSGVLIWPIAGEGMRNTINLEESFGGLMSNPDVVAKMPTALHWLAFRVGGVVIPLGMILFFLFMCLAVWFFLWSKKGIAMSAAGENELFTQSNAINVNQMRILGTVLSTVLGAIGIIMYAQVFGFLQLYNAPLMMGFQCVAAVLIGGATTRRATVTNVIVGALLFQGILTTSLPVIKRLMPSGSTLSEVVRIIISNGIILYALSKTKGGNQIEK